MYGNMHTVTYHDSGHNKVIRLLHEYKMTYDVWKHVFLSSSTHPSNVHKIVCESWKNDAIHPGGKHMFIVSKYAFF